MNGIEQVTMWTALGAGILSFLSPCVLPLIPGYISFITGMTLDELKDLRDVRVLMSRVFLTSLVFVLGFTLVFVLSGAAASAIGQFLQQNKGFFEKIAGVLIIVLGLHLTGIYQIPFLNYEKKAHVQTRRGGYVSSFVMGTAFAFGWTPCIGPILVGILTLAASQKTLVQGMGLLGIYSLGLGIPFILSALFIQGFLVAFKRIRRYLRWVEIASGLLLVAMGVLIFTGQLQSLIGYLPEWFFQFAK